MEPGTANGLTVEFSRCPDGQWLASVSDGRHGVASTMTAAAEIAMGEPLPADLVEHLEERDSGAWSCPISPDAVE